MGIACSQDGNRNTKYQSQAPAVNIVKAYEHTIPFNWKPIEAGPVRFTPAAISADFKYIVLAPESHTIKIFDVEAKKEIYEFKNVHYGYLTCMAISSNNKYAVFGGVMGYIIIFDLDNKKEVCAERVQFWDIHSVKFTSDSKYVVSVEQGDSMVIFDIENQKKVHEFKKKYEHPTLLPHPTMATSLTNNKYIILDGCKWVKVIDFEKRKKLYHFKNALKGESGRKEAIKTMNISADNKYLIAGTYQDSIHVLDLDKRKKVCYFKLEKQFESVSQVAITSDNKYVVSVGNTIVKIFDLERRKEVGSIKNESTFHGFVVATAISPDNKSLITVTSDLIIRIYTLE